MDTLRERFDAVPESVPRARHAVKEYVRALGARDGCLHSVELAVTEAVSNTARHAYPGSIGTFELLARRVADGDVEIVVRDEGRGLESVSVNPGAGFGLPLLRDAADELTFTSEAGTGTEVRMRFALHRMSRGR